MDCSSFPASDQSVVDDTGEHLGLGRVGYVSGTLEASERQPVADIGVTAAVLKVELFVHGLSPVRRRPPVAGGGNLFWGGVLRQGLDLEN